MQAIDSSRKPGNYEVFPVTLSRFDQWAAATGQCCIFIGRTLKVSPILSFPNKQSGNIYWVWMTSLLDNVEISSVWWLQLFYIIHSATEYFRLQVFLSYGSTNISAGLWTGQQNNDKRIVLRRSCFISILLFTND